MILIDIYDKVNIKIYVLDFDVIYLYHLLIIKMNLKF